MAVPCAPPMPRAPNTPPPLVDLSNPPFTLPDPPPLPPMERIRFVSELHLGRASTLYWLASLCRATYAPTSDLFVRVAQAVLPSNYPITFTPNAAGLIPGYGIIKLPQGAVVAVSGTTNLGQWAQQIFSNGLVEWNDAPGVQSLVKGKTMPIYRTAANAIRTALIPLVPADQQILFTGHSMGGAIALCLNALYSDTSNPLQASRAVSFNAPKIGDQRLCNLMRHSDSTLRRLIIDNDFVPGLPPDLGAVNLAVPPVFSAASANWGDFKSPGGAYAVDNFGVLQPSQDPVLLPQIVAAVLAAALGQGIDLGTAHRISQYTERLGVRDVYTPADQVTNWANRADLLGANSAMTAAGIL